MKFKQNKNNTINDDYVEKEKVFLDNYKGNKSWNTLESDAVRVDRIGKFERTYKNKDDSFTALFENVSSQYQTSDGRFEKIDNSLILEETNEGMVHRNKANAFIARFPEMMNKKTFSIERGNHKVQFFIIDSYDEDIPVKMRSLLKGCYKNNIGKHAIIDETDKSKITYPGFCKGGDLEYSVFNDSVKENIIVREKRAQYKFAFVMNLEKLLPTLNDDGSISLYSFDIESTADSEVIFNIPAPIMFDGEGNTSNLVKYTLTKISDNENRYLFMTVADSEWINADERIFPVTIDPQVILNQTENNSALIKVCRCKCDCQGNTSPIYVVGSYELSNNGVENHYLQVEIKNPTKNSRALDKNSRVMRASLIWDISSGIGNKGHFIVKHGDRVIEHFVYNEQSDVRVDVTNFINDMIKNNSDSFTLTFEVSADCDCTQELYLRNSASALRLLVDYVSDHLVEKNGENIRFDVKRAGSGKISLNTGNVVFEHNDITSDSAVMPISVNHIFNGHNKGKEAAMLNFSNSSIDMSQNYCMGDGWKLNIQQNLIVPERTDASNIDDIHYINAEGGHITFEKKYYYVDEGVKHFVSGDILSDIQRETDGTYKKEINGKERTIIEAFMSDNNLTVYTDINKTLYFSEDSYEKYYVLGEDEYVISKEDYINNTNYFRYTTYAINHKYRYYEVNPIYVKNESTFTVSCCDKSKDYSVSKRTYTRQIMRDDKGEYFVIYNTIPITSIYDLGQVEQKVYIMTRFSNDQSIMLSTETLSEDLVRIDNEIAEIDNYLIELSEAKDAYSAQIQAINNPSEMEANLEKLQDEYSSIYNEMNAYQIRQTTNINAKKIEDFNNTIAYNQTMINTLNNFIKNNKNDSKNETYKNSIESYELQNDSTLLHIEEININSKINNYSKRLNNKNTLINECQKSINETNKDNRTVELRKMIEKTEAQYDEIQSIKKSRLEERKKIIFAEKKLPCDYIYDESGNMLTFDYHGRLIGVCDCYNNSISIVYNDYVDDVNGQIVEVITSDKQSIGFTYNDENRLEKITDIFGRVIRYQYNGSKLEKIIYPENDTRSDYGVPATCFTYDASGNIATIIDQSGYILKLAYTNDTITVSDASVTSAITDGEIISSEKEEAGDINTVIELVSPMCTSVTDDSGKVMYQFDNTGRVLAKYKVSAESVSDGKLVVENGTTFAYTEKKRSYSAQSDETKHNYITDAGFESIGTWNTTAGVTSANSNYTEGVKSLMITGDPDADRRVYKTVTGLPADRLHYQLSLWAKAESAQIDSERNTGYEEQYLEKHTNSTLFDERAQRKFGIKAVATYADGSTDEFYASFDWYNTNWQLCQLPIRLKSPATSIKVSFEYGYNLGTAYIDNFRLTAEYGTEKKFSEDGKLLFESDGKIVRCYGYDGSKNPSKIVEIEYATWLLNPEVSHFVTADAKELADKGCRVTRYYYNSKDSIIMIENPDGIITEYEYNENGLLIKSYQYHKNDPSSKRYTENKRDDYGREIEVMDARGEVNGETLSQKYIYEWGNSLVKSVESAGGIKTHYGYSHVDDTLIGITTDDNGIEHTNRMNYTANLLTALDNISGIRYNYKYDGFGRMTDVVINGTPHASFNYDKETVDGKIYNKEVMTLASGDEFTSLNDVEGIYFETKFNDTIVKQSNIFDESKRCTKYTEFPSQSSEKVHTFEYDDEGNVIEHKFGNHSAEYEYDKYNRTTKTDYWFGTNDGHNYTYKYKAGLKNELEEVNGFGLKQTFAHDKLGRQTESKIEGIYSKKATYLKYGDHTTDIIADLTYTIANGNTDREKYSYDKEGNISAIHENGRLKVRYTYDALNRLIREDNKELDLTTTFEYDNGGNIIRQNEYAYTLVNTDELANGNEIVYTYDDKRSDRLIKFNDETITYDENGRLENYRNNACNFERGTLLSEYGSNIFEYDADGLRTKKNDISFTYVDGKLIRQTGGFGTIDFIHGAGGVIGFNFNNTTYIYRRNLMGDVTHIFGTNGELKAKYIYDVWGNHMIVTNVDNIGTINPIRYRGYYYDTETELYYLKARYYDPETGRFISQDSIDFIVPNDLMGLNLFAYCNNNPIKYIDVSGKIPVYNWQERISTSKTIFELPFFHEFIGEFLIARGHTESVDFNRGEKKGFFYGYHDIKYDDYNGSSPFPNGESYGIGINVWEWFCMEVGAENSGNAFLNAQLTPWVQCGVQVGASGIGVNLSFGVDTTLDISLNIGWGGVAIIGAAVVCVFFPYVIPEVAGALVGLFASAPSLAT